jgi:regulatory protein
MQRGAGGRWGRGRRQGPPAEPVSLADLLRVDQPPASEAEPSGAAPGPRSSDRPASGRRRRRTGQQQPSRAPRTPGEAAAQGRFPAIAGLINPSDGPESDRAATEAATRFTITAIEQQERRRRYNIFVDGEFALAVEPDTLLASALRTGDTVTASRLRELAVADLRKRALDAALRLLASRPHSEREVRERLARRGLPHDIIQPTLERLKELGYVDDAAFARFWVEARSGANPRGRFVVRRELRGKGVADETAADALEELPEEPSALKAGRKKARSLTGLEYKDFRTRLAGYLVRRGFSYETTRATVDRLWKEANGELPEDTHWEE